jgi:hypothetical protein
MGTEGLSYPPGSNPVVLDGETPMAADLWRSEEFRHRRIKTMLLKSLREKLWGDAESPASGASSPARRRLVMRLAVLLGTGAAARAAQAAKPQTSHPSSLDVVVAKLAIMDALGRYCRGFDRLDHELLMSVFHTDATAQYLDDPAIPILKFVDGEAGMQYLRTQARTSHQITNSVIHVNGATATSEAYGCATVQDRAEDGLIHQTVFRGRYLDRWALRDGKWAITQRRYILDTYSTETLAIANYPAYALHDAVRDRSEASYTYVG